MFPNPKNLGNFHFVGGSSSSINTLDGLLSINNINFNFPTLQGSNKSFLSNNGHGITSWITPSLSTLIDTNITSPANNSLLSYNGSNWINKLLTKSDIGLGNVDNLSAASILNNSTLTGTTTVSGNLVVNGTTTTVNSSNVAIQDNQITLNSGETGAGVSLGSAGLTIDRGTSTDYQIIFDETSLSFKIGQTGQLQCVATREDSPIGGAIPVWNSTTNKLDTQSGLTQSITNQLKNLSTNTITSTQWGYLSGLNQALSSSSSPTFTNATLNGTITINSKVLTFPSTTGSNGNVLSTNGSGVLSWGTVSSASNLASLSDVNITSAQNTNFLKYNSGSSKWINYTPSSSDVGLGALSQESTNVVFTAGIKIGNQTLYFPTNTGSANYALTTDGSGVLSWADPKDQNTILNGGNSFGSRLAIGTTDNNDVMLSANSVDVLEIYSDGVTLQNNKFLKFNRVSSNPFYNGYITFMPPDTIINSYNLILPNQDGQIGQTLIYNGSKPMYWGSPNRITDGASSIKYDNLSTLNIQIQGNTAMAIDGTINSYAICVGNETFANIYQGQSWIDIMLPISITITGFVFYKTQFISPVNSGDILYTFDVYDQSSGVDGSGNIIYSNLSATSNTTLSSNSEGELFSTLSSPISLPANTVYSLVFKTPSVNNICGTYNMANIPPTLKSSSNFPVEYSVRFYPYIKLRITPIAGNTTVYSDLAISKAGSAGSLKLYNSAGSNSVSLKANATSNYNIIFPNVQGSSNTHLVNDGTGALSWTPIGASISTLSDVTLTSLSNGQLLKYSTASSKWLNTTLTSSDIGLSALSQSSNNVVFSAGINIGGQLLTFPSTTGSNGNVLSTNGSGTLSWSPISSTISALTDVTLTSLSNGQLLKYSTGSSKWLNTTLTSSDVGLSALSTSNSLIQVTSSNIAAAVKTFTSSTTLDATAYMWRYTGSTICTVTIPLAASFTGVAFYVVNESMQVVTIAISGSNTIDGSITTTQLSNQYDRIVVRSNGVGIWFTE
jgi:hypothetical protein